MKLSIVVLDDFEGVARSQADWTAIDARAHVTVYTAPLTGSALVSALQHADGIVLMRDRTPFMADLIAQLPNLKFVVFTGTRNSALDAAALAARNIPVCFTAFGPSKESTAELTWALILAATKKLEPTFAALRKGQWRIDAPLLSLLHGKTLGLVGLGEIGRRVARVGAAFGMNIVAWSPNLTPERAAAGGATSVTFDALLAQSDVVSLHLVLSDKTKHLFGATQFAQMKSGAVLVNTSRAGLVNEAEMVAALRSGALAHAALDVFNQEPLPADHPLLAVPNTTLAPHLGFVCEPVFDNFFAGVVECLDAYLSGEPLVRELKP